MSISTTEELDAYMDEMPKRAKRRCNCPPADSVPIALRIADVDLTLIDHAASKMGISRTELMIRSSLKTAMEVGA